MVQSLNGKNVNCSSDYIFIYQSHLECDYDSQVQVLRQYLPYIYVCIYIKHVYSFYSSYHYICLKT